MTAIRSLCGIMYAEILSILRNRTQAFIFLVVPFLIFLFLVGVYKDPVVEHVPTVILDMDKSPKSREVINAFKAHPVLSITGYARDKKELDTFFHLEKARAAIIIPENFEADMESGNPATLMTVIDGSNMIFTNVAGTASAELVSRVAAQLRVGLMSSKGLLTEKAERIIKSVQFNVISKYNPTYNYAYFLLLGLGINILQQTYLLGFATIISREKEQGSWCQYRLIGVPYWLVLAGKAIPYLLIGLLQFSLLFLLGGMGIGLTLKGNLFLVLFTTIVFLLAVSAFGLLVSALTHQTNSIRYAMVMAMPSFIFSGYTWPLEAMHPLAQAIGKCLPLTWYLKAFQAVTMKGAGWEIIKPCLLYLSIIAGIFLFASFIVIKNEGCHFKGAVGLDIGAKAGVKNVENY